MDEEIRRFEEKQKLTNLQIDKRLTDIEIMIENIRPGAAPVIQRDNNLDLTRLKEEIVILKTEKKIELEKMNQIAKSINASNILAEIGELKRSFNEIRNTLEKNLNEVNSMRIKINDVMNSSNGEKIDSAVNAVNMMNKQINAIERRTTILEKNFVASNISKPIILE